MNEQIKQLANQMFSMEQFEYAEEFLNDEFIEQFAKLVVQECMWKIMNRKEEAIEYDWDVDEAMSAAIEDISEHFGIEE